MLKSFVAGIGIFLAGLFGTHQVQPAAPVPTYPPAAHVAIQEAPGTAHPTVPAATPPTSQPTTIINQPVIERIIERAMPSASSGITSSELDARLQELTGKFSTQLAGIAAANAAAPNNFVTIPVFAQAGRIDNLSNVTITNATVHGVSGLKASDIPSLSYLPLSGGTVTGDLTVSGAFSGGSLSLSVASTSSLVATNATSTNLFATLGHFTTGIIDSLTAAAATITNLTATTITGTKATFTNATTTNATSTNLYASTLNLGKALSVGNGGMGTTTWQTGSIPFFNGANFTEDNSNLFWDNTNKWLGIGTINPRVALDVNGTVFEKGPAADVRAFGAKGDGVTNDTAAVQAALNASLNVYFPSGTYLVSTLTTQNNQKLYGDRPSSVLRYLPISTGYMFNGNGEALRFQNLDIDGGNTLSYAGVTSPGTQSGIHLDVTQNKSSIDGVSIHGFNNIAIGINGDQTPTHDSAVISNSFISNNYIGIDTGPSGTIQDTGLGGANGGEYVKIVGNNLNLNGYAIVVDSGNNTITGNSISSDGYCLYINGSSLNNGGHGTFTSNLCNHSSSYAIYAVNIATGFTLSSNQFFYGNWYLSNDAGMTFANNTIAAATMTIAGAAYGGNSFYNNWFYLNTAITNSNPLVAWVGNYNAVTNSFVNNSAPLTVANPSLYAGGTSTGTSGSNMVTNGSFSTSAGWSFGTGWSIATNSAHSNGTNSFGLLTQNIGAVVGNTYVITYTVSNYVSGGVGGTIGGDKNPSVYHTGNGTYTDVVYVSGSNHTLYLASYAGVWVTR